MCAGQGPTPRNRGFALGLEPPEWENMSLPPAHILSHLTDAHCHPTDLAHLQSTYDDVPLGGLGAMSTIPEDQERVTELSQHRGWLSSASSSASRPPGPKVVACFGYHPWFVHRYTLLDPPPHKHEHYTSIFFPDQSVSSPPSKNFTLLQTLLPYLPDPIPFAPLLDRLRTDITTSRDRGCLTMEKVVDPGGTAGDEGGATELEWKRLTPFKTSMAHQRMLVEKQLEVAIEFGVNVSFHSVAAPGPSLDVLISMRNKHRGRFTNRVNVDIHSGGGWSGEFWAQAERESGVGSGGVDREVQSVAGRGA
ncbi:MAG: hypothetical protein TREMPRED_005307 [Tremellales sp. Tagirdzhanova-0007]|nr:MAG: hypothetical protein TREMPRED_005307 [Tremellales sp. Tagirdzhanova-0007]